MPVKRLLINISYFRCMSSNVAGYNGITIGVSSGPCFVCKQDTLISNSYFHQQKTFHKSCFKCQRCQKLLTLRDTSRLNSDTVLCSTSPCNDNATSTQVSLMHVQPVRVPVEPIQPVQSVQPIQPMRIPVQSVQPTQSVRIPVQSVQPIQPMRIPVQPVQPIQPIRIPVQPVQSVQSVQSVQPIQPIRIPVQCVQSVQPIQLMRIPVQPVQSVQSVQSEQKSIQIRQDDYASYLYELPNEIFECGICFERYGVKGDNVPTSLRCGHSFHYKCLVDLKNFNKILICPICRNDTDCSIDSLNPNFGLMNILQYANAQFSSIP